MKRLQSGMKRIKIGTQLGRAEKTRTVKTDRVNMALEPIMFQRLRTISILNVVYSRDLFSKDRILILKE